MFTISGAAGGDLVKVVSFLISEDNLGPDKNTIILGNVKQYLNQCFNHDGKILEELGLMEADMKFYEDLKEAKLNLEEIKNQFSDMLYKFVYSEYNEELNLRINYESPDLHLVADDGTDPIIFVDLLNKYNEYSLANHKNEIWNITVRTTNQCSSSNIDATHTSEIIYNPKNCYPTVKPYPLTEEKAKLDHIKDLITKAGDINDPNSIKKIIENLRDDYDNFLNSEITTLNTYIDKIKQITEIVKDYTSDDGELFSFMNCAFIKDNVDVILFYLKNSFENDMYEVGVYLLIAAFAMPFGISFTILLIMISNDEIEANKKKEEDLKNRKSQVGLNPIQEVKVENNIDNGNSTEQRRLNQNNP